MMIYHLSSDIYSRGYVSPSVSHTQQGQDGDKDGVGLLGS